MIEIVVVAYCVGASVMGLLCSVALLGTTWLRRRQLSVSDKWFINELKRLETDSTASADDYVNLVRSYRELCAMHDERDD